MMIKTIHSCRICGNIDLIPVLDLGLQSLSGVFPSAVSEKVLEAPLTLVKCNDYKNHFCGLVQLQHTVDLSQMYGRNYGYRSGLNQSMVQHLTQKVHKILSLAHLKKHDLIVDIGSNDATLLKAYPEIGLQRIGVDPSAEKLQSFYPENVELILDFFSRETLVRKIGSQKKAKIITSIAMFYDLESPLSFVQDIYESLDPEGIWVFEQSYMPTMLEKNSYDTICHEHLEYYALKQILWMMKKTNFKIIDLEFNSINGGSFSVTVAKQESHYTEASQKISEVIEKENQLSLETLKPYQDFSDRVLSHRETFLNFLKKAKIDGKKVYAYGASTKGNVILQYCQIDKTLIQAAAEVNETKYGCFTPGTHLPIIAEKEARAHQPDYFVILPWHFKDFITLKEKDFMASGGKLVFPLPQLEIIEGRP